MEVKYISLLVLIFLTIGYFWGRYIGHKEGLKEGRLRAPIALRKKSLEEGFCVLCDENFKFEMKDS
ncbi:hypothetical protein U472_09525 [Orenia metallireducens]|uniref:Uncharacterized protein n=1 Tax=Orenia metallireducens TaxID=1413210 RepID=A0A1C0A7N2_9FIRM|nr:hypothetical protein [Orenia metallireducens]OCL26242.1 hypothetical protein U472_09525 [Orenia metallireducens]